MNRKQRDMEIASMPYEDTGYLEICHRYPDQKEYYKKHTYKEIQDMHRRGMERPDYVSKWEGYNGWKKDTHVGNAKR